MLSGSIAAVLVRRTIGAGGDDVGEDDDAGGEIFDGGGNTTAAVELDKILPSGLWVTDKKAKAAMDSATVPTSAVESHFSVDFFAGFALAGVAVAGGAPEGRASSHVATT